jgi:hypothetical protein
VPEKIKLTMYLFNLTALFAFLFLLVYSLTSKERMVSLLSYSSYYLILLLIVVWVVQTILLLKTLKFSFNLLLKKYWPGIVIALILTSLVFASVKVQFKTLSDETNLLSISMSMLSDKTIFNTTMGRYYYGNLNPIDRIIPIQPLVFPFMVHVLHTLTGFRYQNPFILNFIVMVLFLSGVYITTRKFSDTFSSIAAMLLILSYPVFTMSGTSGGFDLLNSAFFWLTMAAAYYFIRNPSPATFSFTFASLLVFSNIRYESAIFLFILPVLLSKKIRWHYLKDHSYLFFIAPLVSLPYFWQCMLSPYRSHEDPTGGPMFSFTSLVEHTTTIFRNLVDFKYFLPYAGFISIASILISIYLIIEILRKKIELQTYQKYFLAVLAASVSISTIVYLSYYWGVYTHPSSARLFITLSIAFALGPVALRIFKPNLLSGPTLLIISAVCFLYYHPIAVEGRFINTLTLNRTTEHCIDFISKLNDKNILVISTRPGQYTAMGYGAIDFNYANQNKELILYEDSRHLFSKILVFQEIEYESGKPTQDTFLDPYCKLDTLYEIQTTATIFLRISEVKNH